MQNNNLKIINIMLASVDGRIAFHRNESSSERTKNHFTCTADFERMRHLVAQCDVVFHGAHSIETEIGAFRVADLRHNKEEPEWIIFTRSGEISFQSPFWKQTGIPKSLFFVSSFNLSEEPILKVEEKEFHFGTIKCLLGNVTGILDYLKNKGSKKAALLGGGKLNTAFWENNLVDELYLTISPVVIGAEEAPQFVNSKSILRSRLVLKKCEVKENFVFLDYAQKNG